VSSPETEREPLRILESKPVFGAAIAALVVVFFILQAPWPMLGPDESAWMTSALKVLNGKVLGRDAVMAKGPYLLLWHLGAYLLTGPNVIALHLIGAAWAALTGAVVCLLTLRLSNRTGLLAAGLLYTAAMADHALRTNVYAEVLMALPISLGFLALVHGLRTGRARWTAAAGLCVALAVLTKQTAVFYALAMAAAVPICLRGRNDGVQECGCGPGDGVGLEARPTRVIGHWLAALGGALAGALPWLVYVWVHGAGGDFIDSFVGKSSSYVAALGPAEVFNNLRWSLVHVVPRYSLVLLAAGVGTVWLMGPAGRAALRSRGGGEWAVVLPLWLLAGLLSVGSTGRFAAHYFSQAFPVVALVGGLWVAWTMPRIRVGRDGGEQGPARVGLAALLVLAQLVALLPIVGMNLDKWRYAGELSRVRSSVRSAWRVVGEYLRAHTNPDETVFVWGDQTEVLYWAGRELASDEPWITLQLLGFTHTGPLFAERANDEVDWGRFQAELERWQPRYVVIAPAVQTVAAPETGRFGVDDLPRLGEILEQAGYVHERQLRGYELYSLYSGRWAPGGGGRQAKKGGTASAVPPCKSSASVLGVALRVCRDQGSVFCTSSTVELTPVPRAVQAVMATTTISASSRAYSTVVRPSSSFQKLISVFIC